MIRQKQYSFTASDVIQDNNEYYIQIVHRIGHRNYLATVVNNNYEVVNTSNLIRSYTNYMRVYVPNGSIVGTWFVNIYYSDSSDIEYTFKRLFEQPTQMNLNGVTDWRFAYADSNGEIKNITVSELKALLQSNAVASNYLLRSNNLSDIPNKATARNNLDTYSKTEIDDMFTGLENGIASISSFVPASGFSSLPSVTITKSFAGFSLSFAYTANTTDGIHIDENGKTVGTFDVIPVQGQTISFQDTFSPMSMYMQGTQQRAEFYSVGQIGLFPQTDGNNNIRFTLKMWTPATVNYDGTKFNSSVNAFAVPTI